MTTNAWVLPTDGAWSTASNWSGGVPTADQDVLIAMNGTYTVTVSAASTANTMTVNDAGASVVLASGGTLALNGLLQLEAGSFEFNGGTLAGGTIIASGGTLQTSTFGSALVGVTAEGTLTLGGMYNPTIDGITLLGANGTGAGVLALTSGITNFGTTQTITAGTIDLGSSVVLSVNSGSTLTLGSNALLQTTGSWGTVSGSVINAGTISAEFQGANSYQNGTLTISGPLLNEGSISVGAGNAVAFDTTLDNTGTIQILAGGTLELLGSLANTGSISAAGGTIVVGGQVTQAELDSIVSSGASLVVAGTLDNTGGTLAVGAGRTIPSVALGIYASSLSGDILGGVIQDSGNGLLVNNGTLDGVTYEGTLVAQEFGPAAFQLTILDGITLLGSGGSGPGVLAAKGGVFFGNSASLASGTIMLGDQNTSGSNAALKVASGSVLSLGSAVAMGQVGSSYAHLIGTFINQGLISATQSGSAMTVDAASTLTNQGTIVVSGGDTFDLVGSLANSGTLILGAGGTLEFAGGILSNTGSIVLDGGVVELTGATITAAQFQAAASIGAPILLNGTLDNSGGTIVIGAGSAINTLTLAGAIRDGVIVDRGNGLASSFGLLDGVTYQGGLNLGSGQDLAIADGITLTGTSGTGTGFLNIAAGAEVTFSGSQTLDNAMVQLGGTLLSTTGSVGLTLGSRLTLEATSSNASLQGPIVSAGSILASGGTGLNIYNLTNTGVVAVTSGAVVNMQTIVNSGSISVSGGGVLNLGDGYGTTPLLTNTGLISETNATLNLFGPLTLATLSTISRSGGIVSLGFASTLDLAGGTLAVGGASALGQLRDHGVIANGTIADAGGGMVFYGDITGTLRDVTYRGLVNLTPALSSLIVQGLTVTGASGAGAGTVNVLGAGSSLTFQDTQSFDNATINIGSNVKADTLAVSDSTGAGAALAIGAHASLMQRGAMAEIDIDRDLGSALVNDGRIVAGAANGSLIVLGGTFVNAGAVIVANGETMTLEVDKVANLAGNILGGGYWEVGANSTLNLGMDNPILNMNAKMVLNGPGSQVLYYDTTRFVTTSLEQSMRYVGSAGVLVVENGRAFNDPGMVYDSGQIVLAGGTLSAQPLAISATGVLFGSGTVTANAIYDSGHVLATGGDLVVNAPLLGGNPVGNALIAAGATLTANAAVTVPVLFLGTTGTLALGQPGSMGSMIYNFTGDDAIDLVNVGTTGVSLSYAAGAGQGVLTVKSGLATAASLHFKGNYVTANFRVTSDGHGGTLILDPPVPSAFSDGSKVTLGDFGGVPAGPAQGGIAAGGTLASAFVGAAPYDPPPPAPIIGPQH